MIPYGKQSIDENDIRIVAETLRSDWLTTGPQIKQFESAFAEKVDSQYAVAVSNGTAALHAALNAAEVSGGDEVIVPAITFVATANSIVFQNATPVFCDVMPDTLLIDPESVRRRITHRTRAIIAVDFAGQPCDYLELKKIADEYQLTLISDACHSLGGSQNSVPVGNLADLNCFSFHPVKPITTGEGGMVTTNSENFANRLKRFRSHGIDADFRQRSEQAMHRYDMVELGYNYRLTDIQASLGLAQLGKLEKFTRRRNQIASQYDRLLDQTPQVQPLKRTSNSTHAFHLYVVKIQSTQTRDQVFTKMRGQGIGVNVHYRPVHLNTFYQQKFNARPGTCPHAESAYEQILSLPVFPEMTDSQILRVVDALQSCFATSPKSKAA
jgi:perosamine synthetase